MANASLPPACFLIGKMGKTATSLKGSEWGQNEATQKTTHNVRKVTGILTARSPPCKDKGFSASLHPHQSALTASCAKSGNRDPNLHKPVCPYLLPVQREDPVKGTGAVTWVRGLSTAVSAWGSGTVQRPRPHSPADIYWQWDHK